MLERKGITCCIRRKDDGKIVGATFIDKDTRCVFGSSEIKTFKTAKLNDLEPKVKNQENTRKVSAGRKM